MHAWVMYARVICLLFLVRILLPFPHSPQSKSRWDGPRGFYGENTKNNDHNGRKEYYGGKMGEVIDGGFLPPVHVGGSAAGDDGSKEKSGAEESRHCIAYRD